MDKPFELHALPHPNHEVRRFGFALTDPYVEHCWTDVMGPTSIAILRRAAVLWTVEQPAIIPADEIASSLGLGTDATRYGRFQRAAHRLHRFHLGQWIEPGVALGIYTQVAPLAERQLGRASQFARSEHDRLLSEHIDRIAGRPRPYEDVAPVTQIGKRLDHLQAHANEVTRGIAR